MGRQLTPTFCIQYKQAAGYNNPAAAMASRSTTPIPAHVATEELHDFPDDVRKELQRFLAVAAYEQIKNKDTSIKIQERNIETNYHGKNDVVGQVWKFLHLKQKYYKTIVHQEDVHKTGQTSSANLPIVITPTFTRSNSVLILGEGGNVTANMLKRTFKKQPGYMTGRTILSQAKEAAREAKKMLTQMNEAVKLGILNPPVDGEYTYFSGKNESDLDNFICFRMYNWKKIYGPSGGPPELNVDAGNNNNDAAEEEEEFHNAVSSPVANNNENDGVIISDEQMAALGVPKPTYLPKGWILFKARGPMADKKDRYDLMNNGLVEEGGSRQQTRKEEKKEKDGERDYEAGTSNGGRGMPLGASYKDLAIIATQKRKLDQNDRASEIARINAALISKNARWKTTLESVKMMHEIGQSAQAQEMAKELPLLSQEVKALEKELEDLKKNDETSTAVDTNAPVDLFLQRGSAAMGLKTPNAPKKSKASVDDNGLVDLASSDEDNSGDGN